MATPTATAVPPSGTYAVTVEVVEDDCAPPAPPTQPAAALIVVQREGSRTRVNLPIAWSARTDPRQAATRSDLRLEPGDTVHHHRSAAPGCDGADVDATTSVLEVTGDQFVIETALVHDAACDPDAPRECTTRLRHHYVLQEAMCAADCTRGVRFVPGAAPPRREIDCRCRDGHDPAR